MKLNADKTLASLDINGEMDAEALDGLLRKLAMLRADMRPEVAQTMRSMDIRGDVLIEDNPALNIALRSGGGFRLWLRHRGFGWLAYQVDNLSAVGMANYITARTAGEPVNLITDGDAKRH